MQLVASNYTVSSISETKVPWVGGGVCAVCSSQIRATWAVDLTESRDVSSATTTLHDTTNGRWTTSSRQWTLRQPSL